MSRLVVTLFLLFSYFCITSPAHAEELGDNFCVIPVPVEDPNLACRKSIRYAFAFPNNPPVFMPINLHCNSLYLDGYTLKPRNEREFPFNQIHHKVFYTPDGYVLGKATSMGLFVLNKDTSRFTKITDEDIYEITPIHRLNATAVATRQRGLLLFKDGKLSTHPHWSEKNTANIVHIVDLPNLNAIAVGEDKPIGLKIMTDDGSQTIDITDFNLRSGYISRLNYLKEHNKLLILIKGKRHPEYLDFWKGSGDLTYYQFIITFKDNEEGLSYTMEEIPSHAGWQNPPSKMPMTDKYYSYDSAKNTFYVFQNNRFIPISSLPSIQKTCHDCKISKPSPYIPQSFQGLFVPVTGKGKYHYLDKNWELHHIPGEAPSGFPLIYDLTSINRIIFGAYAELELTADTKLIPIQKTGELKNARIYYIIDMPSSEVAVVFSNKGTYVLDKEMNFSKVTQDAESLTQQPQNYSSPISKHLTKYMPSRNEVFVTSATGYFIVADKRHSKNACNKLNTKQVEDN